MSKDPCVSFFGNRHCNFVARYDFGAPNFFRGQYNIFELPKIIEATKPRTYVHDVCTSCGKIVKRSEK